MNQYYHYINNIKMYKILYNHVLEKLMIKYYNLKNFFQEYLKDLNN